MVSHDLVTVSWDDPGDDTISGYVILRRDKDIHPQGTFVTLAPDTRSAATSYVDASVDPGRRYVYRIKAINAAGTSDRSTWVRAYTPAAPQPSPSLPAKPTGLTTDAAHDTVTLTWDDPADGTVTGYVILRRDKDVHPQGTFQTITAHTGTAATSYLDATAEPERRYVYRIKAVNTHGRSTISNWARGYTPAAPQAVFIDGDNQNDQSGDDPAGTPGNSTPPGPGDRANVSEGGTDLPADTTTTGEVDVGGTVTGTIGSARDMDWFAVELAAGTRYQIDLEGSDTDRGTLANPHLSLYGALGSPLQADDDSGVGLNARVIYTPSVDSDFYAVVSEALLNAAGTYTLSVIVLGANGASEADTDYPNTTATTGRVEVGGSATGNVGHGTDFDTFKVTLMAGRLYQIDLEGAPTGRGSQPDPTLALESADIGFIDGDEDGGIGLNSRLAFTPTADGTYYLLVSSETSLPGTYTLSVRHVNADSGDDPDASGDGGTKPADRPEESADRHTQAFIKLDPVSRYGSAVEEPLFQYRPFYNDQGQQIGVIQVDPVLTTWVQGRYEGEIDFPGDVDWIRFDAIANSVYEIRVFRPQTATRGALKPRFEARSYFGQSDPLPAVSHLWFDQDGNGSLVEATWSSGFTGFYPAENRFVYSPSLDSRAATDTTAVFVSVEGGDGHMLVCPSPRPCDNPSVPSYNTHTQVGEYVVTVRELDRPHISNDANCRRYLDIGTAGGSMTVSDDLSAQQRGRINWPADVDCIQMSTNRPQFFGKTVRLRLLGNSLRHGTLPDPVILGVYQNGVEVANTYDNDSGYFRDSEVAFTLENAQEVYQILVTGHCPPGDPDDGDEADEALFNICRRNVGTYRLMAEVVD